MNTKPLKLVIDARPLARNVGGMTRYIAKLLPHLVECKQLEICLYTDQPIHSSFNNECKDLKIRMVGRSSFSKLSWHIINLFWLFQDKPDLFWSPRQHLPVVIPKSTSAVVTIHDLVWKTQPQTVPFLQRLSERLFMKTSTQRANHIICISKSTNTILNKYFSSSEKKSTVIKHGIEVSNNDKIETKPKGQYFLAVGTLEPRKNYSVLIKSFEEYAKKGNRNLIIVGKKGWLYDDIITTHKNSPVKDRIEILENVNDQQLQTLYRDAGALISPSLDEGYGLPPLEATIHGIPLLLSDIPVYKELYPYALSFFKTLSTNEITASMMKLDNTSEAYYVDLSKQSNWHECAQLHMNCFIKTAKSIA